VDLSQRKRVEIKSYSLVNKMTMQKRRCKNWIKTYLEYVDNTEPPLLYKTWCAISALSIALERKCYIPWVGGFTWYPNMYIVLVGPPGQVRKSTAIRPMVDIVSHLDDIHLAANSTTRESLIRSLSESSSFSIDSETGEQKEHCSMTILASELAVFIGGNSGQLMSDLSDWWDCDDYWEYKTKHQGCDYINGVWVNMLGATTPDLIEACLPVEMIGSGFASRIIFVYEQEIGKLVVFPTQDKREEQLSKDLIHDIKLIHEMSGEFEVSECFKEKWAEWYRDNYYNPPFRDTKLAGYTSRRPTHIMKLCMLVSASKGDSMMLTSVELEEANELLKNTEKKMPRTFTSLGRRGDADIVNSIMTEVAKAGTITYTKLLNKFYMDVNTKSFDEMIEALRRTDFLEVHRSGNKMELVWKRDGNADNSMANSLKRG